MPTSNLPASEEQKNIYQEVFEHSLAALAVVEEDGIISLANTALVMTLGRSKDEVEGKMNFADTLAPEDLERIRAIHHARITGSTNEPSQHECLIQRKDGTAMHGLIRVVMLPGTKRTVLTGIDITLQKQAEEALRQSESRFRGAFEASGIGMALVGLDGRCLAANRSLCLTLGYSEHELCEKTLQEVTHPDDIENDREHRKRLVADEIPFYQVEKRYHHKTGYVVRALLCLSIVRDRFGYPLHFVAQVEDVTEQKLLEEKLRTLLITDELTGLYNRRGFFDRGQKLLAEAAQDGNGSTLFVAKLADMRLVNETLGQKMGDQVLVDFADILRSIFEDRAVIARIGGVEFAVLTTDLSEATELRGTRLMHRVKDLNGTYEKCPISAYVGTATTEAVTLHTLEQLIDPANKMPR